MKKIEYIPQTPSTKSDIDSERKSYTKPFNFSQYFEYKENNENNSGRKSCNKINTEDEQTKEKLENIRNNISNIRQKVSSYSKIYENISTQIDYGINNIPKEDILKNQNKNFQQQILELQKENQRLKNKINELEDEREKENNNIIVKYKKKHLDEMKELQKIFENTIENKNKEIERLNYNQHFLMQQIEELKFAFNKEKNQLRKYNEELLNKNFDLQKQITHLYYTLNNQKLPINNLKLKNNHNRNKHGKLKSEDLTPVIEEDKSFSVSNHNTSENNNDNSNNSINNNNLIMSQNDKNQIEFKKSLSTLNIKSNKFNGKKYQ